MTDVGDVYHEVLIAGFGGQGVVLAGRMLALAGLAEKRQVVWAPSYGPEMRGGSVHCTVIVSSRRIGSPEVSLADTVVLMDRSSMQTFADRVKPGGLVILNSTLITSLPSNDNCEVLAVPAGEAAEALGNPRVANVVMLGTLLAKRPIVEIESLVKIMRETAGKAFAHLLDVNLKALARGAELTR
jgi:2-oxoglutarate ferredoxin oxidoreductase subunit gamma